LWLTTHADRIGRRRVLVVGALLMVVAGFAFAARTPVFAVLVAAATIGVMSPSGNRRGRRGDGDLDRQRAFHLVGAPADIDLDHSCGVALAAPPRGERPWLDCWQEALQPAVRRLR